MQFLDRQFAGYLNRVERSLQGSARSLLVNMSGFDGDGYWL